MHLIFYGNKFGPDKTVIDLHKISKNIYFPKLIIVDKKKPTKDC